MPDFRDLLPPPPWEVFSGRPKYRITEKGKEYLDSMQKQRTPQLALTSNWPSTASGRLWATVVATENNPKTLDEIAKEMGTWFFPDAGSLRRATRAAFEEGYIEEVEE